MCTAHWPKAEGDSWVIFMVLGRLQRSLDVYLSLTFTAARAHP